LQGRPIVGVGLRERFGQDEILRRLAVAEGDRAVFRPDEAGVLVNEAAAAGLDPDLRRQAALARSEQLGHRGAEVRVRDAAVLRIAALDAGDAGRVRVVLRVDAAKDRQVVHLLGGSRH
jgi:hypothetical protein